MTTRFKFGDAVTHTGRPAAIVGVITDADGHTRYHIVYNDADEGAALNLLGRVLRDA